MIIKDGENIENNQEDLPVENIENELIKDTKKADMWELEWLKEFAEQQKSQLEIEQKQIEERSRLCNRTERQSRLINDRNKYIEELNLKLSEAVSLGNNEEANMDLEELTRAEVCGGSGDSGLKLSEKIEMVRALLDGVDLDRFIDVMAKSTALIGTTFGGADK